MAEHSADTSEQAVILLDGLPPGSLQALGRELLDAIATPPAQESELYVFSFDPAHNRQDLIALAADHLGPSDTDTANPYAEKLSRAGESHSSRLSWLNEALFTDSRDADLEATKAALLTVMAYSPAGSPSFPLHNTDKLDRAALESLAKAQRLLAIYKPDSSSQNPAAQVHRYLSSGNSDCLDAYGQTDQAVTEVTWFQERFSAGLRQLERQQQPEQRRNLRRKAIELVDADVDALRALRTAPLDTESKELQQPDDMEIITGLVMSLRGGMEATYHLAQIITNAVQQERARDPVLRSDDVRRQLGVEGQLESRMQGMLGMVQASSTRQALYEQPAYQASIASVHQAMAASHRELQQIATTNPTAADAILRELLANNPAATRIFAQEMSSLTDHVAALDTVKPIEQRDDYYIPEFFDGDTVFVGGDQQWDTIRQGVTDWQSIESRLRSLAAVLVKELWPRVPSDTETVNSSAQNLAHNHLKPADYEQINSIIKGLCRSLIIAKTPGLQPNSSPPQTR